MKFSQILVVPLFLRVSVYIYGVTLPSRRASIRPENLDGTRAERPRSKKIARAVLKSPERRAIVIFRFITNYFLSFVLLCTLGNPPESIVKKEKKNLLRQPTFPVSDSRAEIASEDQDSAESRVEFAFSSKRRKIFKGTAALDRDNKVRSALLSEDGGRTFSIKRVRRYQGRRNSDF